MAQPRPRGRAAAQPARGGRRVVRHPHGETLALVGESGCGKSTVARLIVGLYAPTRGRIVFDGVDLADSRSHARNAQLRRRMQMIFQDPYASLNPRWRVRESSPSRSAPRTCSPASGRCRARVGELLTQVGLAPEDGDKYPHEFSGGQRQRISIARALSSNPEFLVCDEPTSALDVSVQAQILNLMKDLQQRLGLTYLFISHNLAVVAHIATRVGVMYLGRLVELADATTTVRAPAPSLHAHAARRHPGSGDDAAVPARRSPARCPIRSPRHRAAPSIRAARTPTRAAGPSGPASRLWRPADRSRVTPWKRAGCRPSLPSGKFVLADPVCQTARFIGTKRDAC